MPARRPPSPSPPATFAFSLRPFTTPSLRRFVASSLRPFVAGRAASSARSLHRSFICVHPWFLLPFAPAGHPPRPRPTCHPPRQHTPPTPTPHPPETPAFPAHFWLRLAKPTSCPDALCAVLNFPSSPISPQTLRNYVPPCAPLENSFKNEVFRAHTCANAPILAQAPTPIRCSAFDVRCSPSPPCLRASVPPCLRPPPMRHSNPHFEGCLTTQTPATAGVVSQ
jgi:hypothetical protein